MGTPIPIKERELAATVSSPVIPYTLTPEEIAARYGPPNPRKEDNPFHARIVQAVKGSDSLEEAAGLLNISVGQLNQYIGRSNIPVKWDKKPEKEAETVEIATEIQKTEKKKTRLQIAREKLTREQYLAMKKQGLSDADVLKKAGLKGYFDVLSILKNQWGVQGLGLRKQPTVTLEKYQEEKRAAEAIGVFLKDLGDLIRRPYLMPIDVTYAVEALEVFLVDLGTAIKKAPCVEVRDDDEILWATPFKSGAGQATLRVHDKGVTVNTHALTELENIKHIRIGVRRGNIIVAPTTEKDPQHYTLGQSAKKRDKSSGAKIGGAVLVNFLARNGIKPGKYNMIKNQAKGWWEAEVASR